MRTLFKLTVVLALLLAYPGLSFAEEEKTLQVDGGYLNADEEAELMKLSEEVEEMLDK